MLKNDHIQSSHGFRKDAGASVGNPTEKTTSPSFNCSLALPTSPPTVITGSEHLKGEVCITDGVGTLYLITGWLLVGYKISQSGCNTSTMGGVFW